MMNYFCLATPTMQEEAAASAPSASMIACKIPRHGLLVFLAAILLGSITSFAQEKTAEQPNKEYTAVFSFRDGTIHDGDIRICKYGDGYARGVRLSPQGPPLMSRFPWAWRFIKAPYDVMTTANEQCRVEGQDSERLVLHFRSTEPKRRFSEERTVILTYDAPRGSYVFDIDTCLTVGDHPLPMQVPRNHVDVTDPYFTGMPGRAYKGGVGGEKRYDGIVFEAADGSVYQVPLNHLQAHKQNLAVKKNGRFAFFGSPQGNLAFQLLDDTYQACTFEVCTLFHDLHLVHRGAELGFEYPNPATAPMKETYARHELPAHSKYRVHYRVLLLTDDEERELVSRMTMHPLSELEKRDWSNCLVFFPGKSAFDAKFDPNFDSGRGDSSPWYWEPVDDERILAEHFSPALQGPARPWAGNLKHCAWDPGVGHDRPGSASIHRDKPGASLWFVDELGPGWYCPPFPKTKQLTITAYVKTKGVEGKGAFIAADCPGESPLRMISARLKKNNPHRGYESEKITGTRDWTKVTCVVPKPPRGRGVIQLRLEGTGQAWFDDVVVEEMQNDKE